MMIKSVAVAIGLLSFLPATYGHAADRPVSLGSSGYQSDSVMVLQGTEHDTGNATIVPSDYLSVSKLRDIQEYMPKQKEDISDMKKTLSEMGRDRENLQRRNDELSRKVDDMQRSISSLENKLDDLSRKVK